MDALLASLFDVPVAVCTARAGDALEPPLPAELPATHGRWSDKRRLEFEAGRHCARQALRKLVPPPLAEELSRGVRGDEDGVPCWPSGVVGSISHTGRQNLLFAAAAVSRDARSLGLDAELHGPLEPELRSRVLTANEARTLTLLGGDEQTIGQRALVVFSAKEAFYKCQYPLSRTFLGFDEVEVELDWEAQRFEARLLRDAGPLPKSTRARGRFLEQPGLVVTALHMP